MDRQGEPTVLLPVRSSENGRQPRPRAVPESGEERRRRGGAVVPGAGRREQAWLLEKPQASPLGGSTEPCGLEPRVEV